MILAMQCLHGANTVLHLAHLRLLLSVLQPVCCCVVAAVAELGRIFGSEHLQSVRYTEGMYLTVVMVLPGTAPAAEVEVLG